MSIRFFISFVHELKNIIEIKRTNFQQKSKYLLLLFCILLFGLGVLSICWDWKASIPSLIFVFLFYLFQHKIPIWSQLMWCIVGFISLSFFISWILNLSLGIFILQCVLFSLIMPIISLFKDLKHKEIDIIFSLNSNNFSCLCPENNEYKGYALNPMGYKKYFKMEDIVSVQRDRNNLLFVLKQEIIRPRELKSDEIEIILNYFRQNHTEAIAAIEAQGIRKEEDRLYRAKLIVIVIPCILGGWVTYFLGDNGRNIWITSISLLGAIGLGFILSKIINLLYRRKS